MRSLRPTPSRALRAALAALLLVALPAACGRTRAPGGAGRLEPLEAGGPALLVLEGSPYEMGWWHGHLLREAILERAGRAGRLQPADYIEAFADQTLHRLSERLRQELDGMAAATGLQPLELIRAEVAPAVLRFRGSEAALTGFGGLAAGDGGYQLRMHYGGPQLAAFDGAVLFVHRKPTGGPESLALARAGSLGAYAMITAAGTGYALAEVDVANRQRLGFGGGRPFPLAAREALEGSEDADRLAAELTGTMGHVGIAASFHPHEHPAVRAVAGVQVYGAPDPPWVLGDGPFLAIGPFGDPTTEDARAFQAQVAEPTGLAPAERWLRLEGLRPWAADAPHAEVRLRVGGGRAALAWVRPGGQPWAVALPLARQD